MARVEWTGARDARLRRLRADGRSWAKIAAELGVTLDMARERGRRIGALAPSRVGRPPQEGPSRPPLPAGHPRAWGLLTDGTVLAGTEWPGWEEPPPAARRREARLGDPDVKQIASE
jgi:hypothetical protein